MQIRSSGGIFHDNVRFSCCYWATVNGYDFEMEPTGEFTDDKVKPDIKFTKKFGVTNRKPVVYVEIQLDMGKRWKKKTYNAYHGRELSIINLNKIEEKIINKEGQAVIEYMYQMVADQLENETMTKFKSNKVRDEGNYLVEGECYKKKNAWKYEGKRK